MIKVTSHTARVSSTYVVGLVCETWDVHTKLKTVENCEWTWSSASGWILAFLCSFVIFTVTGVYSVQIIFIDYPLFILQNHATISKVFSWDVGQTFNNTMVARKIMLSPKSWTIFLACETHAKCRLCSDVHGVS